MVSLWSHKSTHQGLLETQLHNIFPNHNTIKNARKEAAITNPLTGSYLEVDLWMPDIGLCFEFQDDYHFKPAWYSHVPLSFVELKDNTKRSKLLARGQTLISVPFWWDGSEVSLQGTVVFHRPDLLGPQEHGEIPTNPPSLGVTGGKSLMLASFPNATVGDLLKNSQWWVGEKWDGIRCFWSEPEKQMYSRQNLKIDLQPATLDLFGKLVLDGELWCGRGSFQDSQNFVVSAWQKLESTSFRLVCFDEASQETHLLPFEQRYSLILDHISPEHPMVVVAPRFLCTSEVTLLSALQSIIEGGGEGLILRKTRSRYVPGRSPFLIKIKASYSEEEALVVKVEEDGSLLLKLPNGLLFAVAKKDCLFTQEARNGDIVTFSFDFSKRLLLDFDQHDALSSVPSNPVVHRIRSDLSWEDVIHNAALPHRWFGNETHQFFESTVKRSLERLLVQSDQYQGEAKSHRLLHYYHKYPEMTPHLNESNSISAGYSASWKAHAKRREYFDKFAAFKGADPLNPLFWYDVSTKQLNRYQKGYNAISSYYNGKLSTTLMQLYPNIGLKRSGFKVKKIEQSWKNESQRKAYFDKFAASKGMDPLNPSFWYTVTLHELGNYGFGYNTIIKYYGGKLSSTLMHLYPDIGLQKSYFKVSNTRRDNPNSKRVFCDLAHSVGIDPLVPADWYGLSYQSVYNFKGLTPILRSYNWSIARALMGIFPDIGLEWRKFTRSLRQRKRKQPT